MIKQETEPWLQHSGSANLIASCFLRRGSLLGLTHGSARSAAKSAVSAGTWRLPAERAVFGIALVLTYRRSLSIGALGRTRPSRNLTDTNPVAFSEVSPATRSRAPPVRWRCSCDTYPRCLLHRLFMSPMYGVRPPNTFATLRRATRVRIEPDLSLQPCMKGTA
jgi:hypothetical protein